MTANPYVAGDSIDAGDLNGSLVPIGCILGWAKTIAGVPALNDGFVECSGQVLSDGDSPIDGQTIPDLNGSNYFLRGNSTSGGTGGESTHVLTDAEMPSHHHSFPKGSGSGSGPVQNSDGGSGSTQDTDTKGSDTAHENKPPFYNVVWVMRVK